MRRLRDYSLCLCLLLLWPLAVNADDSWRQIQTEARGQTVWFNAWGGDPAVNRYLAWVSEEVKRYYAIDLRIVPVADAADAVKRIQTEAQPATFAAVTAPLWRYLDALHPALWRAGKDFPASPARMDTMLNNGTLRLSLTFNPLHARQKAASGELPTDSYSFGFTAGTLGNVHFVTIPANARAVAGAKVVVNFLLSPEAQLRKADAAVWGDPSVLDPQRLPDGQRQALAAALPQNLPPVLAEPHAAWVDALEQEWLRRYGTH
ncbi:TPA: ABC transporter substrate-binding protein [Klebsiella pneumoniae]|nr:ABC transporter substrate-binding protein [Klebsiella pneumoniae]HBY9262384.1 ABC transporter substrate-binding protein [Klebsiella pneumoniae]